MKRYPILEICARVKGHKAQHNMLRDSCRDFKDWEGLLQRAEQEGMTPLLRKHLDESECPCPTPIRRSLSILSKCHQQQAEVRIEVLKEILEIFQQEELTPILIKGAAICQTVYPDPALRPMRDMDILLDKKEVHLAQEVLCRNGFVQSSAPLEEDHYHLPPVFKKVKGVQICIELHWGLYPNIPPYYPEVVFKDLLSSGKTISIDGIEAHTFSDEEMLHYMYQHAFHAPLAYDSYKLINAADVISFTEKYYASLDWEKIQQDYPLLYNALPLMHNISPWDFGTIPEGFVKDIKRKSVAPFTGWPHKRFKEYKATGGKIHHVLLDTFLPSSWWLRQYYGIKTWQGYIWTLLVKHPLHVSWWVGIYTVNQLSILTPCQRPKMTPKKLKKYCSFDLIF